MKKLFIGLLCLAMLGLFACELERGPQEISLAVAQEQATPELIYARPFHDITLMAWPSDHVPSFTLAQYGYIMLYYPSYCDTSIPGHIRVQTMVITNEAGFYQRIEGLTASAPIYDELWFFSDSSNFRDFNGDGYRDIMLRNWEKRTAQFLIWCSDTGEFVFSETLRELYPFSLSSDTDLLHVCDPENGNCRDYRYRDGQLQLVREAPRRTE
ncbi:MAG: hypothetical protein FWB76_06425 [Oscillospiraceae bacterium]|nr:hypothetical protein [Oscillospiraceae bacterium]